MIVPVTRSSAALTWIVALASALWMALALRSPVAWAAVMFISVVPAVVMMVMAHTPAKSVAEIIRDAEAGRAR